MDEELWSGQEGDDALDILITAMDEDEVEDDQVDDLPFTNYGPSTSGCGNTRNMPTMSEHQRTTNLKRKSSACIDESDKKSKKSEEN